MLKAKTYTKEISLKGEWIISRKIDGVRCLLTEQGGISRLGNKLNGLTTVLNKGYRGDVEIFCGTFKETISLLKTLDPVRDIKEEEVYSLEPLDERLFISILENPSHDIIMNILSSEVAAGYEGLVLRQNELWYKVKKEETFDVPVTGFQCGKGKHDFMLGAFLTPMGKVGTGFTDKERHEFFSEDYRGKIIEVSCMEITKKGKFRHARFIRLREDL